MPFHNRESVYPQRMARGASPSSSSVQVRKCDPRNYSFWLSGIPPPEGGMEGRESRRRGVPTNAPTAPGKGWGFPWQLFFLWLTF